MDLFVKCVKLVDKCLQDAKFVWSTFYLCYIIDFTFLNPLRVKLGKNSFGLSFIAIPNNNQLVEVVAFEEM